jgi:hypothetical protein
MILIGLSVAVSAGAFALNRLVERSEGPYDR